MLHLELSQWTGPGEDISILSIFLTNLFQSVQQCEEYHSMLLRFFLFFLSVVITSTQAISQCCNKGFTLNIDNLSCETEEGEVEKVRMELCQDTMVGVDARYTSFSYYGGEGWQKRHCCEASKTCPWYVYQIMHRNELALRGNKNVSNISILFWFLPRSLVSYSILFLILLVCVCVLDFAWHKVLHTQTLMLTKRIFSTSCCSLVWQLMTKVEHYFHHYFLF